MRIGELSRRSGVSVRMLRYYESMGLVRPTRTPSGYRTFGDCAVQSIERIRLLNGAGLPLEAIRRVLPCAREGSLAFEPCAEFQSSVRKHIEQLDRQISELSERRRILAGLLVATA